MATHLAQAGLVAKGAEQVVRNAVLQRISEITFDEQDSEANRAAAVDAIFNMAAVIPEDRRLAVAESFRPLAAGDYQRHRFDTEEVDLLSNFQFSQNSTGMLRASAVRAVARFAELGTECVGSQRSRSTNLWRAHRTAPSATYARATEGKKERQKSKRCQRLAALSTRRGEEGGELGGSTGKCVGSGGEQLRF
jgi:hypothetical protein